MCFLPTLLTSTSNQKASWAKFLQFPLFKKKRALFPLFPKIQNFAASLSPVFSHYCALPRGKKRRPNLGTVDVDDFQALNDGTSWERGAEVNVGGWSCFGEVQTKPQ